MHGGMLTIFKQLTPDERARAAKFLHHRGRRRKSGHENSTAIQAKPRWLLYTADSLAPEIARLNVEWQLHSPPSIATGRKRHIV